MTWLPKFLFVFSIIPITHPKTLLFLSIFYYYRLYMGGIIIEFGLGLRGHDNKKVVFLKFQLVKILKLN